MFTFASLKYLIYFSSFQLFSSYQLFLIYSSTFFILNFRSFHKLISWDINRMFRLSVTDFNFGTETCDTSKYWKRWMVGRWMEPTESLVLCSKSFFSSSIFQIICLQRSRQLWYFHFSFLQRSQLKTYGDKIIVRMIAHIWYFPKPYHIQN